MDKITHILENVVRCNYFQAGVHIKNSVKNSYQDGLGRTTQTLDHVVVVHVLIWDKRKSQINEYSDINNFMATIDWPSKATCKTLFKKMINFLFMCLVLKQFRTRDILLQFVVLTYCILVILARTNKFLYFIFKVKFQVIIDQISLTLLSNQ